MYIVHDQSKALFYIQLNNFGTITIFLNNFSIDFIIDKICTNINQLFKTCNMRQICVRRCRLTNHRQK